MAQYIPKYEELYRSGGLDSTAARRDAWKLERLGVLPHYRQKGVGRALLQAVCGKVGVRLRLGARCSGLSLTRRAFVPAQADRDRDVIITDVTNPAHVRPAFLPPVRIPPFAPRRLTHTRAPRPLSVGELPAVLRLPVPLGEEHVLRELPRVPDLVSRARAGQRRHGAAVRRLFPLLPRLCLAFC